LDEIQAAILEVKLKYLDAEIEKRRSVAAYYSQHIKNDNISLPQWNTRVEDHVFHLYVIRCREREALKDYLEKKGIQTVIHYPIPPHQQQAYKEWNHLSFPLTEQIHKEVLSIPISPILTVVEQNFIINAINAF
jgi:dTDP-4-amino-4,6-dideoxygalactose transaminase